MIETKLLSNILANTCKNKKNWLRLKADCKLKQLSLDFGTNDIVTYLCKTSWKETFDSDIIFQCNEAFKRSLTSKRYLKSLLSLFLRQTFFLESKSEDCFTFCQENIKKGWIGMTHTSKTWCDRANLMSFLNSDHIIADF